MYLDKIDQPAGHCLLNLTIFFICCVYVNIISCIQTPGYASFHKHDYASWITPVETQIKYYLVSPTQKMMINDVMMVNMLT